MKKMNDTKEQLSWLGAIERIAKERSVSFPRFIGHAMGTARTECVASGRFATFKRRLVSDEQAGIDGIEWGLWQETGGEPEPVITFRSPLTPNNNDVEYVFSLLSGWLLEGWTVEEANEAVNVHSNVGQ